MDRDQSAPETFDEWVPAGLERRELLPAPDEERWTLRPSSNGAAGPRAASQPRREARERAQPGRIDLNSVTFETLRSLGFSVTQAKRFIAQRDRLGGFRSIDQVDGLPGFPRELKSWLHAHGGV